MLHGGSHISSKPRQKQIANYNPPKYHWEGFGRKSCKPEWYAADADRTKRPLELWEGDTCGCPKIVPKTLGNKAPYNHSNDERIYRPEVAISIKQLGTLIPANFKERQMLDLDHFSKPDRHGNHQEKGITEKYKAYKNMTLESNEIRRYNKNKAMVSTVKDIMGGVGAYPNGAPNRSADSLPFRRTRADFGY